MYTCVTHAGINSAPFCSKMVIFVAQHFRRLSPVPQDMKVHQRPSCINTVYVKKQKRLTAIHNYALQPVVYNLLMEKMKKRLFAEKDTMDKGRCLVIAQEVQP